MKFVGFVALIFTLTALASAIMAQQCGCSDAYKFRGEDVSQYGLTRGPQEDLTSITACFWMSIDKAYTKDHEPTILSYGYRTKRYHDNEFLIYLDRNHLVLKIHSYNYNTFYGSLHDGLLHHVCLTWESSTGVGKLYKDGVMVAEKDDLGVGRKITGGGVWAIGQDQDRGEAQGFQEKDSFQGLLAEIHVWNRALCPSEIEQVASKCPNSLIKGNYLAQEDFTFVNLDTVKPSCCD